MVAHVVVAAAAVPVAALFVVLLVVAVAVIGVVRNMGFDFGVCGCFFSNCIASKIRSLSHQRSATFLPFYLYRDARQTCCLVHLDISCIHHLNIIPLPPLPHLP